MILRATLLSLLVFCGLSTIGLTTWYKTRHDAPAHFGDPESRGLDPLVDAVNVMEDHFFSVSTGSWEDAIDWTAAVIGTHLSMTMSTISAAGNISATFKNEALSKLDTENLINHHFSQLVQFYFGQNSLSLRLQAFDDMLWVVLEWLETLKLMKLHSRLHWNSSPDGKNRTWYGEQFEGPFAHRARIFYDLASRGWDTSLCGGGMIWSPYLRPYKNAITNQLFIAASVGMYLYFPGDDDSSPFIQEQTAGFDSSPRYPLVQPHDPRFLKSAIDAYSWLVSSNMTNAKGLYVDGFHITDDQTEDPVCDERNEMVYTYNQGVVLSGMRGLWESTGDISYLSDGYRLIESVINATNWHNASLWTAMDDQPDASKPPRLGEWGGLGRDGLLEEVCDASGTCSQNGQTFKGIYFWHLSSFCRPLPRKPLVPGTTFAASPDLSKMHEGRCQSYTSWVAHNARSAAATRSEHGEFGMWWNKFSKRPLGEPSQEHSPIPVGSTDYRNRGIPNNGRWKDARRKGSLAAEKNRTYLSDETFVVMEKRDLNDRGRGRTVETQSSGLAAIKAFWDIVHFRRFGHGDKGDL